MLTPFDLNVLCTPPAFILSQDQTLENIVSYHRSPDAKTYSRAFVALLLFVWVVFLILNCSSLLRTFVFALYFSLRCSIFNDRFDFALAPSLVPALAATRLLYHTAFTLSIPFSKLFLSFFQAIPKIPLGRQLWYYITSLFLCQAFFETFLDLYIFVYK